MAHTPRNSRTDSASRIIKASPQKIFQAFVDPWAWESWLPPKSMKGRVHVFDFRAGGRYRMELTYLTPDHATKGKTWSIPTSSKADFWRSCLTSASSKALRSTPVTLLSPAR